MFANEGLRHATQFRSQPRERHALDLHQQFGPANIGYGVDRWQLAQPPLADRPHGHVIFLPLDVHADQAQAVQRRAQPRQAVPGKVLLGDQGGDVLQGLLGLLDRVARMTGLRMR